MNKKHTLALCLLAFGIQAQADNIQYKTLDEQALRACIFIEDRQLRLRCFDDATGRSAVVKQDEAPAAAAPLDGGLLLYKQTEDTTLSWLDSRWELAPAAKRGTFSIRPYQPVYLLPVYHNSSPNTRPSSPNPANTVTNPENLDSNELKFQLSLKTKVMENIFGDNGDLWFAYTQSSRWQVMNEELSRPFRETNYEPELIFTWRTSWSAFREATGWEPRLLGLSLNHQSNGRALPLSRSWNRVIGMVGFERENTMFQFRPWMRIDEKPADDDNPDITDFVGRGDWLLVHKVDGHELSLLTRHNFKGGRDSRGAVQFDWAFPLTSNLRGHLQYFTGYGESLIDYNYKSDYLGLGLSLVGWY
ncbi:phospholipase A [Limnobacter sp.]|uniref:phospholipase A n=1 Tax=Limnobacter sp. TaxID=2003368 RepID=UPI003513AC9C